MAVNGSQQGSSWDPHTAFKIVASQHAPPSLQTMLRLRLAAQEQVRPGVACSPDCSAAAPVIHSLITTHR